MAGQDFLDIELIKKRAISGVVTFTLRTFFIFFFTTFAWFVLTAILDQATFGIFVLVSAMLNIFVYFSDIGLAAALIQKKGELTQEDLSTTFIIQQGIVLILITIGFILSGYIARIYRLDSQGMMLLRVLIFSLFLSSLKTIPSLLLERQLKFVRFVVPHVVENLAFYSTALILALFNFGIASFTWAVLIRGIVGLVTIYFLSPWKPSLNFSKNSAKKLVTFGIPFQMNSILALLKDDLLIIVLGKILPFGHLGYIGWSQKVSQLPIRFFIDNVNKITFPAYSRLQEHRIQLGKAIEKSLFFATFLVYPSIFGIVAIAPKVIELIPRYQKWEPALPLLYLFAINTIFSAISTTFTNALFAIGKPKIVLNFMVFWTIAIWVLTYPLVLRFGFIGVGIASALVAGSSLTIIYFVKKEIPISIAKSIVGPLVVSTTMFFMVNGLIGIFSKNIFELTLVIIFGAIIYLVFSFTIFRRHLVEDFMIISKSFFNKQ